MKTVPPDPKRDIWFLGTLMHFHALASETSGRCSIVEQLAPAGFSPPLHVHENDDAFLYVLEGQLTVCIGTDVHTLITGQSALLPRLVPHTFRADRTTRLLEVTTPGGSDLFYRELGTPAAALALPTEAALPDAARLEAAARAYRATVVGPPLEARSVSSEGDPNAPLREPVSGPLQQGEAP